MCFKLSQLIEDNDCDLVKNLKKSCFIFSELLPFENLDRKKHDISKTVKLEASNLDS